MAYTDKDALKIYLDIPSATTADDTLLTTLIARAQAVIDTHCGQTFEASVDATRTFIADSVEDGGALHGRDIIFDRPLAAITSVTNGDGEVVAAGDYMLLPRNDTPYYALRLKQSSGLEWTYDDDVETDTISIVGRWAYSITPPADIVQACTRLAAWMYRQRDNSMDLDRVVNTGNAIYAPARMPADVLAMLAPYVRAVS